MKKIYYLLKKQLQEHPYGELIRPLRIKIRKLLDDDKKIKNKRREFLSILCLEKAIDENIKILKEEPQIIYIIQQIIKLYHKEKNESVENFEIKRTVDHVEKKIINDIERKACTNKIKFEYYSIYRACLFVEGIQEIERWYDYDLELFDNDLDPDSHEDDWMCSNAYAKSFPNERTNIEKRREFWNWYLDEAIPKAYNVKPNQPCVLEKYIK